MKYGLIGERLSHSFSKEIHEKIADYDYQLKEIKKSSLADFFAARDFLAINVTIPYKEEVIKYLDEIDDFARSIGAVNTVVNKNGKLFGYNTDYFGARDLIDFAGVEIKDKKVLILGSGGTSKTMQKVVFDLGAKEVKVASRRKTGDCITYEEARKDHLDAQVIINTTPVGTYPDNDGCPIEIEGFKKLEGVIDVIYNPLRTTLVKKARKIGVRAEGGLYMLAAQAVYAKAHFLGEDIDKNLIKSAYKSVFSEKENVVLIGMPSSGKSTVAKILAKKTGRKAFDSDVKIVQDRLESISEIFSSKGESVFRAYEKEAIKELSKMQGAIIATGGGAILDAENVEALKSNGKIFFIDRPLEKLMATKDRPLTSSRKALEKKYNERYEKYLASADVVIEGLDGVEKLAEKIWGEFLK